MSYTELHFGKLRKVKEDFSLDALKELILGNNHLEIEDFEEKIIDGETYFEVIDNSKKYKEPFYIKYILNNNSLYEMIEHSGEKQTEELDLTEKQDNGDISFAYMFYNGGTCFSEMLQEGLESIE